MNLFFEAVREKAISNPKTIIFPECNNEKILRAVSKLEEMKAAGSIFVGTEEALKATGKKAGVSVDSFQLISLEDPETLDSVVELYRKESDLFSEKALRRKAKDPLNFAAMATRVGIADCLAAGADYTTGEVILACQSFIGVQEGISLISSMGFSYCPGMEEDIEDGLLGLGDCAVVVAPDAEELAQIAIMSAETTQKLLGREARVALLSFSTKGSGTHENVDKVREAVRIANERRPELLIDGEYQVDAAISEKAARKKVKTESRVAGKANVLVFPNLEAGNICVKLLGMATKGSAYGPFLMGFRKPVTDFSRTATEEEILINLLALIARAE